MQYTARLGIQAAVAGVLDVRPWCASIANGQIDDIIFVSTLNSSGRFPTSLATFKHRQR
jgi:hypothetical protein